MGASWECCRCCRVLWEVMQGKGLLLHHAAPRAFCDDLVLIPFFMREARSSSTVPCTHNASIGVCPSAYAPGSGHCMAAKRPHAGGGGRGFRRQKKFVCLKSAFSSGKTGK